MTRGAQHLGGFARRSLSGVGIGPAQIMYALYLPILVLCLGCRHKPPDLAASTRIDVQYADGALNHFFPSAPMQQTVLSEEERRYVRSYDMSSVTDHEQIRTFAYHISQGQYHGRQFGVTDNQANIICYQDGHQLASFAVHRTSIVTKSKIAFKYPPGFLSLKSLAPAGLEPLSMRWECAMNLSRLVFEGHWPGPGPRPPLDPNQWCDVIVRAYGNQYIVRGELGGKKERMFSDTYIARRFTCPAIHVRPDANEAQSQMREANTPAKIPGTWMSNYAMNSNCGANSPEDMVFLFESQPGWNQHGGPELFTFDNHDPKGGCVLLNDGTVKFIRTEEELRELRWK